ncbi:MAG: DUF456 domain-containing protein [Chlorobi bacterium]|nr:DUF456 domain-containing protein [Chlorobiota bacterium]
MVDYILLTFGILSIIIGLLGCVLPVLPGPPVSFIGLLLLNFSRWGHFSLSFMLIMAGLAVVVTILDYIVPVWGTKKWGGSRAGVWGATIGLIAGLFFFPPVGIILGPLVGAVLAESLKGEAFQKSFHAGLGALFGFFIGIGLKLIASGIMTFYFFKALF